MIGLKKLLFSTARSISQSHSKLYGEYVSKETEVLRQWGVSQDNLVLSTGLGDSEASSFRVLLSRRIPRDQCFLAGFFRVSLDGLKAKEAKEDHT